MKKTFLITSIIIFVVISTIFAVFYIKDSGNEHLASPTLLPSSLPAEPKAPSGSNNVRCTMDVKKCTNGSYVGRIAPSCSFAPCLN